MVSSQSLALFLLLMLASQGSRQLSSGQPTGPPQPQAQPQPQAPSTRPPVAAAPPAQQQAPPPAAQHQQQQQQYQQQQQQQPNQQQEKQQVATTSTTTPATNEAPTLRQQQQEQEQDGQPPRRQSASSTIIGDEYLVGVGVADITGPAADINLMGYAKPSQDSGGIHLRQFSRSIIIQDKEGHKILYTSIDNGMISQLLRIQVLKQLGRVFGPTQFNESNVMLTATHSHSCPGGFFQYLLYNIPSAGFIQQTLDALTDGIVRSVVRARDRLQPARLYYNEGELLGASINRSPTSYLANPAEERARYEHDTDKTMHLLKVVDRQNRPFAMLNWFAVHGTSMNSSNRLISSDNKGYAALLFEQEFSGGDPSAFIPGKAPFVAIFAQANEGDVSPNTRGARCVDTGQPCDLATSTCGGHNDKCIASGPGRDQFESTKIIAYKQYQRARQLFLEAREPLRGPVRFIHEHIDMSRQLVPLYKSALTLAQRRSPPPSIPLNITYNTCPAALGYSFAAGTTDGPGSSDFQQGDTATSRYWNMVRDFVRRPSKAQERCQRPKPIFLSTGEMDYPYQWHPRVVPTQIVQVGQVAIVGLPGEFTTMSGRRVRQAVSKALQDDYRHLQQEASSNNGGHRDEIDIYDDLDEDEQELARVAHAHRLQRSRSIWARPKRDTSSAASGQQQQQQQPRQPIHVVLSGLSNIYTSYVATVEEYELQRYEAASTLYGPHTLQAYVNQFRRLAALLATNQPPQANQPQPPDNTKSLFTLKAGVLFDSAPHGRAFGDLLQDVNTSRPYRCQELVQVSFVAGNPRNDLRQEDSFIYVERYTGNDTWTTVATDANWETKFIWERTNTMFGESKATAQWEIPQQCHTGYYRIRHLGAHKNLFQTVSQYSGKSSLFKVVNQFTDEPIQDDHLWSTSAPGSQTNNPLVKAGAEKRESESLYRKGYTFLSTMIKKIL